MTSSDRKLIGNNKLPPPPTRTISLGDKLPPPRRPPSPAESDDDSGAEEDDPKAQVADNMPDMTASYRCPPVLRFREGFNEPKIHVHPHLGTYAASGSHVITGYGTQIKVYDLAMGDVPMVSLDTKDVGSKDSKVTAMDFRPSVHDAYRGAFLWIGTKEGHLFEMDIHAGHIVAAKHVAHPHPITHIFRYGQSMVTMDECGKTLIFSPSEDGQDISLQYTQPRVLRTTEKQEFVKLIDGKLWTATRTEQHSHGYQRSPIIRVYDIFAPGAAVGRSLLPCEHVGSVTSATILPSQPDYVYVGHEEGYISIWALRTDDGYPKCTEAIRVAMSDVLCLEGVNDRLWAGARNGMISVYDVSQKPWVVTNSWHAHPGLPVLRLSVNCCAIEWNRKLCVVSVGRDECLRLWDGLLGAAWIGKSCHQHYNLTFLSIFLSFKITSYRKENKSLARSVIFPCSSSLGTVILRAPIHLRRIPSIMNS
jgi:WD40 repeat protein